MKRECANCGHIMEDYTPPYMQKSIPPAPKPIKFFHNGQIVTAMARGENDSFFVITAGKFKGSYKNVTPEGTFEAKTWKPRTMKATDKHYLDIPKEGAWTILLCGKPYHKWGFYVRGHKWRPLRYFHKFGIIQTKDYQ